MKPFKVFLFIIILLSATFFYSSCDSGKSSDATSTLALALSYGPYQGNLSMPAIDTATLILGTDSFVLPKITDCKDVSQTPEIGFDNGSVDIFTHDVDFSQNSYINISFDIDTSHGTYSPTAPSCTARVLENTTIYDLQVLNCAVKGFDFPGNPSPPNPATSTASFRFRCTKQ